MSAVIVNSDDFGETVEITRGIVEALDAGVVTSTTILANMPGTQLALAEAARRGRTASFGVHLNLCEGPPLTRAPSLTGDDGRFHPKRATALRAVTGRLDPADVAAELEAQIAKVREAGVEISHLDSHKHLHQLPGVAGVVAGLARKLGIERVRCTLEDGGIRVPGRGPGAWASRAVRRHLAARAGRRFREAGLRHPQRVFDVRDLMQAPDRPARLALLRRPDPLTELICHVGTRQADLEKPGSCARHDELRFLLSDEFRGLVDEAGVELTTFWAC